MAYSLHVLADPIMLVVFPNLPSEKNLRKLSKLSVQALWRVADISHVA
jgi:hypothetical protein